MAPPEPVRETAASVAFGALWERGWDGRQAVQAGTAQALEVDDHRGLGFQVHPRGLFQRLSWALYSVVIHPKNLGVGDVYGVM